MASCLFRLCSVTRPENLFEDFALNRVVLNQSELIRVCVLEQAARTLTDDHFRERLELLIRVVAPHVVSHTERLFPAREIIKIVPLRRVYQE